MPRNARPPLNRRERRRPELIGLQEAADYCDVSYRTVRRWIASGHLNAVRVGPRLLKVDALELEAFLQPTGGAA
jgi:excisionase family DNA binding protein